MGYDAAPVFCGCGERLLRYTANTEHAFRCGRNEATGVAVWNGTCENVCTPMESAGGVMIGAHGHGFIHFYLRSSINASITQVPTLSHARSSTCYASTGRLRA